MFYCVLIEISITSLMLYASYAWPSINKFDGYCDIGVMKQVCRYTCRRVRYRYLLTSGDMEVVRTSSLD